MYAISDWHCAKSVAEFVFRVESFENACFIHAFGSSALLVQTLTFSVYVVRRKYSRNEQQQCRPLHFSEKT
jgi:hypothetical protein